MSKNKSPNAVAAGFSLIEVVISTVMAVVVIGATLGMVNTSHRASGAHRAKSRAVGQAEKTVDRLVLELRQSSSAAAPGGTDRYRIESDGVGFRRVVGVGTGAKDLGEQQWSEEIRYRWDATSREVLRRIGAGPERVIARDISTFTCAMNAEKQFICTVVCVRRIPGGDTVSIRRTFRATPQNSAD